MSAAVEIAPGVHVTIQRVLGDRCIVRELPTSELGDTLPSGIMVPQQSADHQRLLQGEIVAVGEDVQDATLLPGLRIICGRWSRVPLDTAGKVWVVSEDAIEGFITVGS